MTARHARRPTLILTALGLAAAMAVASSLAPRMVAGAKEHIRALSPDAVRPQPTGAFPVGRLSVEVDVGTPAPGRVDVWYPADADRIGVRDRVSRITERFLHPSKAAAPWGAAPHPGRHPGILYIPSWFSTRDENSFALANLASHGFVVAAVDDIIHGAPLTGDDRTAQVASLDYASTARFEASRIVSRRRAALAGRAASSAIDTVFAHPAVAPYVDRARIGVLGFSFGGSVATSLARAGTHIRAAINLDGDVIATESWPPAVPYLFLTSDVRYPTAEDLASSDMAFRFESVTTRDTYDLHLEPDLPAQCRAFSVRQAVHETFSDRLLMPSFRDARHERSLDRLDLWSDINRLVVSFLAAHLRDATDAREIDVPAARFGSLPRRGQHSSELTGK